MDGANATERLSFVEQVSAELSGPSGGEARERLEARYDDVLAALEWFVDNGQPDEALRLANDLDERPHYEHMLRQLPLAMGADAFDRVRASGRALSPREAVDLALTSEAP